MVKAAGRAPDAGLFYSDEDKIDADGRRFDPYFKPDWDPDLVLGQNYVCHFTMARTELVRALGGFRAGYEGSQDHDLVLRCAERLEPAQIVHVPRVLYHWRAIAGSSALARDAKDYASAAGAKAIAGHLDRKHPGAAVEELPHGHYRVRWPLPARLPMVSLVVPTRDKAELLRTCVEGILSRTTYPEFEIVVVDNQSSDPETLAYLAAIGRLGRVRVLRYDAPFNYSAINNWAVQRCDGDVIGLVNNDTEVITAGWLEEMVSQAVRPDVGAVGAMLYYPNDTIQHAGIVLGVHGVAAHAYAGRVRQYPGQCGRARVAQSVSAVTAACLLVRREVFAEVGGLDESLAVAFNDVDFCLRVAAAGYRNVWTPFAELYHHESATRGAEDSPAKLARFNREVDRMTARWGDLLRQDPYYNPNLTVTGDAFDLAFPPRKQRLDDVAHARPRRPYASAGRAVAVGRMVESTP
jgi:GT2 family glycosyltransferase